MVCFCLSTQPHVTNTTDNCQFSSLCLLIVSQSRAALSLLGYCYYHIQDFTNSAECYEQLTQLHPEVEEYKVYYAQSLYKAGAYPEALKASFVLDNPSSHIKVQRVHTARLKKAG